MDSMNTLKSILLFRSYSIRIIRKSQFIVRKKGLILLVSVQRITNPERWTESSVRDFGELCRVAQAEGSRRRQAPTFRSGPRG